MEIKRFLQSCKVTAIFMVITALASCEDFVIVDCGDCYADAPVETAVYVKVNENYIVGTGITIYVYEGDYEDGILYESFTLRYSSDTPISLLINKKYTFTAQYFVGEKSYTVFDETIPSVKYSTDDCEESCFYVYDHSVDLRLKYIDG